MRRTLLFTIGLIFFTASFALAQEKNLTSKTNAANKGRYVIYEVDNLNSRSDSTTAALQLSASGTTHSCILLDTATGETWILQDLNYPSVPEDYPEMQVTIPTWTPVLFWRDSLGVSNYYGASRFPH